MKKLLLLVLLASCSVEQTPYFDYQVAYNPQTTEYGNTYWASHGISMLEPIPNIYKFTRCYVDEMRTKDDGASRMLVKSYDEDTNNVVIYLHKIPDANRYPVQNPIGKRALDCSLNK